MFSPSTSSSDTAKRPDDLAIIRILSTVLSNLEYEKVPWYPPDSKVDENLQFFNYLSVILDNGACPGLSLAATGKFDEQGPMVTIVVSRDPSEEGTSTEPAELGDLHACDSEPLGFSVSDIEPSSITAEDIEGEAS